MSKWETEVLIIGGGIIGASVGRELSRYKVDVILTEKSVDVGQERTKTSGQMVRQGPDVTEWLKHYHLSKLCWESMDMMEPLCKELDIPYKKHIDIILYRNEMEKAALEARKQKVEECYAAGLLPESTNPHFWIDRSTLREWEPNVSKACIGALCHDNHAMTDPVRLTIALIENAKENGIKVLLGNPVEAISKLDGGASGFEVETSQGIIKCQYIINAAGEYGDKIARLADADDFILFPLAGYQAVLDKKVAGIIGDNHRLLFSESNYIMHTVHVNLLFGCPPPNMMQRRYYHNATKSMIDAAWDGLHEILPDISEKDIINSWVGHITFRSYDEGWEECKVGPSRWVPNLISACLGFPGVSASPAIAREVVHEHLVHAGLKLEEKPNFNLYRKAIPIVSELSDEEKQQLIAQDPRYGHLVCRCETVTEGEICEAIRRGATTIDGIKFRCRPGMGRCQGGFCSPRVVRILARELNIPLEQVTKKGGESRHLYFESKGLLRR